MDVIAAHCSCHSGIGEYLFFRWLWHEFRWWSLLIYFASITAFAFIRGMLGVGCDD